METDTKECVIGLCYNQTSVGNEMGKARSVKQGRMQMGEEDERVEERC